MANPVQSRPSPIESPSISGLTAPSAPDPSTRLPNRLEDSRQVGPRASHAACCPDHLAQHRCHGLPTSPLRGYRTLTQPNLLESRPHCPFPLPLIPGLTDMATSLRWIRAKQHQQDDALLHHLTGRDPDLFSGNDWERASPPRFWDPSAMLTGSSMYDSGRPRRPVHATTVDRGQLEDEHDRRGGP